MTTEFVKRRDNGVPHDITVSYYKQHASSVSEGQLNPDANNMSTKAGAYFFRVRLYNNNKLVAYKIVPLTTEEAAQANSTGTLTHTIGANETFQLVDDEGADIQGGALHYDPTVYTSNVRLYKANTANDLPSNLSEVSEKGFDTIDGYDFWQNVYSETKDGETITKTNTDLALYSAYKKKYQVKIVIDDEAEPKTEDDIRLSVEAAHKTTNVDKFNVNDIANGAAYRTDDVADGKRVITYLVENQTATPIEQHWTQKGSDSNALTGNETFSLGLQQGSNGKQSEGYPVIIAGNPYNVSYDTGDAVGKNIEMDDSGKVTTITHYVYLTKANYEPALTPEEVLGDAYEFGIVADTYKQSEHTETNFAVKHYNHGTNFDIEGTSDNPYSDVPFYIGEMQTGFIVGRGTNADLYVYTPQSEIDRWSGTNQIRQENTGQKKHQVTFTDTPVDEINAYVDGMIDAVRQTSTAMAQKTTLRPSKVTNGKPVIDTTSLPDGTTIYVDCSNIIDKIAEGNEWEIHKKDNQTIVLNIPSTGHVEIGKFKVWTDTYPNGVESTTVAMNRDHPHNIEVDDAIFGHVFFNMPNASSVYTKDASAMFLAPNASEFTQTNGAGWIVCGGTVDSGSEWHFYRHDRHFSSTVGSLQINKRLNDDAPAEAKQKTYKFYIREKKEDNSYIYYYNNPDPPVEGEPYNPVNSSSDPVALEITGTGSYKLEKLEPPKDLEVVELEDGREIAGYALQVTGETTTSIAGGRTKYVNVTNTYTKVDGPTGNATLKAAKALGDKNTWPANGKVSFSIARQAGAGNAAAPLPSSLNTEELTAAGEVSFGAIAYTSKDAGKTYYYEITEKTTNFSTDWTSGPSKIVAKVVVGAADDLDEGKLKTTVSYSVDGTNYGTEAKDYTITNTYTAPAEEKGSLIVKKSWSGNLPEASRPDVSFTVTGPDNYSATKKLSGFENGSWSLADLKLGEYTVTESGEGVTGYDVVTSYSVSGGKATLSKDNKSAEVVVTNSYTKQQAGTATLGVKKQIKGNADYKTDEEFTFKLEAESATDSDGEAIAQASIPMPSGAGNTVEATATAGANNAAGEAACFGAISYERTGTYYYKITEQTPDSSHRTVGMTYNENSYWAKVTVEREGNLVPTKLKTTVKYAASKEALVNEATAGALVSDGLVVSNTFAKVSHQPQVVKQVSGAGAPSETYNFTLTDNSSDKSGEVFVAEEQKPYAASVTGAGAASFPAITYTKAGTYTYEMAETEGATSGMAYSKGTVTLTVNVAADETTGALTATASYSGGDDTTAATKNVLINTYTAPTPTPAAIEKYVNKDVHANLAAFDSAFTYDILAYVTEDANKVVITDELTENVLFSNGENTSVSVVDLGTTDNHNPGAEGTVSAAGTSIATATHAISGQTLTVTIPEANTGALDLRGHWVKVTFDAKLNNANGKVSTWNEYTNKEGDQLTVNTPVNSEALHKGIRNSASYVVYKSGDEEGKPTYSKESNIVTVTPGTTNISVAKQWKDGDGTTSPSWPAGATVTVKLLKTTGTGSSATTVETGDTLALTSSERVTFSNLPVYEGVTYGVTEASVSGVSASDYTTTVTGDVTNGFTITNTKISTTSVSGKKIWADNNNEANKRADVTIKLQRKVAGGDWTDVQGKTATIAADATDDALKYSFADLPQYDGSSKIEYRVIETGVPEGYTASGGTESDGYEITNTIKDKEERELPVTLKVHKTGAQSASLKDTTFTLTDSKGQTKNYVTDEDGTATITFQSSGTWTLKETDAPAGYTVNSTVYDISVSRDGTPTITYDQGNAIWTWAYNLIFGSPQLGEGNVLEVKDSLTKVKVSKVDVAGQKELAGATIQVLDAEDNAAKDAQGKDIEWVSTTEPHEVEGLKTGVTYTLRETVAPDGYTIASDTKFTIDETGKVTSTGTVTEDGVILIKDAVSSFTVSKKAVAGEDELPGAKLKILVKGEGDKYVVAKTAGGEELTWTSTDTAKTVTGLKTGVDYVLREEVAPAGYTVATDITFTLDKDGNVIVKGKVVEGNALLIRDALTAVRVSKVDIADRQELEGATLQVLDKDGKVVTTAAGELLEWTSGKEPKLIEGLAANTAYTLRETVAPAGYDVTTDITFAINDKGEVTTTGNTTKDKDGNTIILVEDAAPAIEKYVNKDVHADLAAFDTKFTYDILAYVTADADKLEVTDTLNEGVKFVSAADQVAVADLGASNNHLANGSVSAGGPAVAATSAIDGKSLTVTIADATALRGHWVKVTYEAQLDNNVVGTLEQYANKLQQVTGNAPVIAENAHEGVPNTAGYKVYAKRAGEEGYEKRHERESNTVTVTPASTSVHVQKKWTNANGEDINWPQNASVTVKLLFDGKETAQTKTLSVTEPTATFANLPVYENKTYAVTESGVTGVPDGFVTTITGDATNGYVITNKNAAPAVEKYVNKDVHADLAAFDVPFTYDILAYVTADAKSVTITDNLADGIAFANGDATIVEVLDLGAHNDHKANGTVSYVTSAPVRANATFSGKSLTVTIPDATKHRGNWIKLTYEAKLDNGVVGNWKQYEDAATSIANNGAVISAAFANGHQGVPNTAHYAVYTQNTGNQPTPKYEQDTNTVTVTPKTTKVSVAKKWVDSAGANMAWPAGASVEVELLQGETVYDTKTISSADAVEFTGLPVYEAANKQYTVREKTVPTGYSCAVTGTAKEGFTVTNTMDKTDVSITKVWHDFNDEDEVRPSTENYRQYLHLWANDVDVTQQYADKLAVTMGDDAYSVKWTGLPKMNGTSAVVYKVSEDAVPNYTASTTAPVASGASITNSHMPKIEVNGYKIWADHEDVTHHTRPDSITVNLLANDSATGKSAVVKPAEDGRWSYSFADLDKYDANGDAIVYSVTEDAVTGYDVTGGTSDKGYVLTNTIHDHDITHTPVQLVVRKADAADEGKGLADAEFTLAMKGAPEGTHPQTYTTNKDGRITIEFPAPGTYTLTETKAPAGYTLEDNAVDIVVNQDKVESVTYDKGVWSWIYSLVIGNPEVKEGVLEVKDKKTSVSISKVDVAGGAEVAGARIQVIDSAGTVVEEWTSTTEPHKIEGLKTGEAYTLRETVAPNGYTIATDTVFQLKSDGTVDADHTTTKTKNGVLLVNDAKTSVRISKTDVTGEKELSGAHIQILNEAGDVVELSDGKAEWTSSENAHTVMGLKTGVTYNLRETVAPDGYTVAADTKFTIDTDGTVRSDDTVVEGGRILIKDALTKVTVSKVDIADGEELEGAHIQILDKSGHIEAEWISKKDETTGSVKHTIEGLKTGVEYTLRETVAPAGYAVASDTKFTIDQNGKVTSTGTITKDGVLLVEDALTKVKVSKVDIAGGEEVAGAHIQIIQVAGGKERVVEEWDSGKVAQEVEGLVAGVEYILRETVAPAGYTVATDTTFKLDKDGKVTAGTTTTKDGVLLVQDAKTKVTVSKTDIDGGAEIAGAQLQVIEKDAENRENVVENWTSEAGKSHVIEGLKTGVTYTLRETVAPDGFTVATDTTFTIDATGKVTTKGRSRTDVAGNTVLLVEDAKTFVKVSKLDIADGKEVAGAHIQVLNGAGEVVVVNGEKVEWNSDGVSAHEIRGLKTGVEYTLRETVAPAGYNIATDIAFTIEKDGTVTTKANKSKDGAILVEDAKSKVVVSKTDVTGDEELEGAHIQIVDSEGKVFDEWTTKKDGNGAVRHLVEGLVAGVTYTLRETVAPDGYTIATETTFSVDEHGKVTTTGAKTTDANGNTVLLVQDAKTKVKVSKTDITDVDNKEVAGAHIQLFKKADQGNDELVEEWDSTTEAHQIEGLVAGKTYILRETVAPAGYTIATDVTFSLDQTGKITASTPVTEGGVILVQDAMTEVAISKHDVTNDKELAGAKIQIIETVTKEGGSTERAVVREWTSTEEAAVIKGLKTGVEYTLHEETAPAGYTVAADTTFSIKPDGTVETKGSKTTDGSGKTVLLVNDAMTSVKISKTDVTDKDNKEIAGATIAILYTDAEGKEQTFTSWTSTDQPHEVRGLTTGVEYTLRETVAPDGYAIASDTKFTIDQTGKVTSSGTVTEGGVMLVQDAKTKVKVSKTDVTGESEVEGATLQLIDKDGKVVREWTSTKNGGETFEGLKTGVTYILRETVAPTGYAIATDTTFQIDEHGKVTSTGATTTDANGVTVLLVEDAKAANANISLKKEVTSNVPWETTEEFEFTLAKGADGQTGDTINVSTAKAKSGEDAEFDVTFGKAGTYYYTITETPGKTENLSYDTEAKWAKVVVSGGVGADYKVDSIRYGASKDEVDSDQALDKLVVYNVYTVPALEKYINKDVHQNLPAYDTPFTYDILAFVTKDADRVVITDSLAAKQSIRFLNGANTRVTVQEIGETNDHQAHGTVEQAKGRDIKATTTIKDKCLTVEIDNKDNVQGLRGKWVRVTYDVVLDNAIVGDESGYVANDDNVERNGTVTSSEYPNGTKEEPSHDGVATTASYVVYAQGADGKEVTYSLNANTITVTPPTVRIEVAKQWKDASGATVEWPKDAKVTIELIRAGEKTGNTVTLDAEHTSGSFNGMPVYENVSFEVDEASVQGVTRGFTTAVTGDKEKGFVLTNTYVSEQTTRVRISKVDVADGKELKGAHLQILDKDGNVVTEWVSDGGVHEVEGLQVGQTYTLRETVAPDGYDVATDIEFTINNDGSVTTAGKTTTDANGNVVLLVEDTKKGTTTTGNDSNGSTTENTPNGTTTRNVTTSSNGGGSGSTVATRTTSGSSLAKTGDPTTVGGLIALAVGGVGVGIAGIATKIRRRRK